MIYEFSILDLFPYLVLYGLGIFLACNNIRGVNRAYAMFIIILVFSSIRYGIGYDYYGYQSLIQNELPEWKYERFEPISLMMIKVGKYFNSSELYFAIYALLILYPIYFVSKRISIAPVMSMLVYLLYPSFFLQSMDIIRNSLAFSLVFLSYYFLCEKKYIGYFLFCYLAAQSHTSGYLGFLLIFIALLPDNKNFSLCCIVISFILGSTIPKMQIWNFIPGMTTYISMATPVGSMKYLMLIFVLLNYVTWDKLKSDKGCIRLLKIESLGISLFFLFMVDDTLSSRFSLYFLLFMILALPYQLKVFKNKYKMMRCLMISFFLSIIIFQWYLVINNYQKTGERMAMIPYQTIFHKVDYSNYLY